MDSAMEVDEKIAPDVYTQDYSPKNMIDGIKTLSIKTFLGEDGDFAELFRINAEGKLATFPDFKIAQINRTMLIPGSIKAWHLHILQDEIWHVIPNGQLFVGLWDLRKNSKTFGQTMRINLGESLNTLYIPRGVAHGVANFTKNEARMLYFVTKQFDKVNPDEKRIKWDAAGIDFWQPRKE